MCVYLFSSQFHHHNTTEAKVNLCYHFSAVLGTYFYTRSNSCLQIRHLLFWPRLTTILLLMALNCSLLFLNKFAHGKKRYTYCTHLLTTCCTCQLLYQRCNRMHLSSWPKLKAPLVRPAWFSSDPETRTRKIFLMRNGPKQNPCLFFAKPKEKSAVLSEQAQLNWQ